MLVNGAGPRHVRCAAVLFPSFSSSRERDRDDDHYVAVCCPNIPFQLVDRVVSPRGIVFNERRECRFRERGSSTDTSSRGGACKKKRRKERKKEEENLETDVDL